MKYMEMSLSVAINPRNTHAYTHTRTYTKGATWLQPGVEKCFPFHRLAWHWCTIFIKAKRQQ